MQGIIFTIGLVLFISAWVKGLDRAKQRRIHSSMEDMDVMYAYVGGMLLMIASLFF